MGDENSVPQHRIDYQFEEAHRFNLEYRAVRSQLRCKELADVSLGFMSHVDRIHEFGQFTISLVYWAKLFTAIKKDAEKHVDGLKIESPAREGEIWAYQQDFFDKWKERNSIESKRDALIIREGSDKLKLLMNASTSELSPGVEISLATMITDAYSAFEIAASDLWVGTVNCCPSILAEKLGEKQIPLNIMERYGYDIKNRVGEISRAAKRVNFDSLDGIQAAYRDTFDKQDKKPCAEMFSRFPLLTSLSLLRNCIVHDAAIANDRGFDAIKRLPGLESIEKGSRIILTGPVVRDCINVLVGCTSELTRFVDQWLVENAERCRKLNERRVARFGEP